VANKPVILFLFISWWLECGLCSVKRFCSHRAINSRTATAAWISDAPLRFTCIYVHTGAKCTHSLLLLKYCLVWRCSLLAVPNSITHALSVEFCILSARCPSAFHPSSFCLRSLRLHARPTAIGASREMPKAGKGALSLHIPINMYKYKNVYCLCLSPALPPSLNVSLFLSLSLSLSLVRARSLCPLSLLALSLPLVFICLYTASFFAFLCVCVCVRVCVCTKTLTTQMFVCVQQH
jgi:hypothetical protein